MFTEEGVCVHHKAGSAVPALRAVTAGNPVLDRVESFLGVADPFDRRDVAIGDRRQIAEAGVDRPVVVPLGRAPADHDGAGPATSLATAHLGPREARVANMVAQDDRRVGVLDLPRLTVQPELEPARIARDHRLHRAGQRMRVAGRMAVGLRVDLGWLDRQRNTHRLVVNTLVSTHHSPPRGRSRCASDVQTKSEKQDQRCKDGAEDDGGPHEVAPLVNHCRRLEPEG
jgi:hypothetical protein